MVFPLPLALGAILALALFSRLAPEGTSLTSFALFMGVAMAVTAFPVLARILTDRGIATTEIGVLALSVAAYPQVNPQISVIAYGMVVLSLIVQGGLLLPVADLLRLRARLH